MAKKVLIALAVVFGIVTVVIAVQPADYVVERHVTVNAPATVVFEQVNDFHKWAAWSPWEKKEKPSELKKTYSGAESGTGARYGWDGKETGAGTMTITESKPAQLIAVDLNFEKPFKAANKVAFTMKPAGQATDVSWSMSGHNDFMGKAFAVVMDMDKMVGPDFEVGLEGIKAVAEAESKKALEDAKVAQDAAAAAATVSEDAGTP